MSVWPESFSVEGRFVSVVPLSFDHQDDLIDAAAAYKELERNYSPLQLSKDARKKRSAIIKSDGYKAEELLVKARKLIDKGQDDKARPILERILEKFPETAAAERAEQLLQQGG